MERAFKCDLCSDKFISQSKLNHHTGREHAKPGDLVKKHSKCNVCEKEFKAKQHLIAHMMTHTGERPFKCTLDACEMEFTQKSTLNRHIKRKHSDERPFKCNWPGCKYRAKLSSALREHMKNHSDDKPFACPNEGCNFRAKQKSNLTRHLSAFHSTAKAFPCDECDYEANFKQHLKRHMRRRHSTRGQNSKYTHVEDAEYLVCSPDLESLLNNQDEASRRQCDQSGREQRFDDANELCDPEPGALIPNVSSTNYSTSITEDLQTSEAEDRENIETNNTHTPVLVCQRMQESAAARK